MDVSKLPGAGALNGVSASTAAAMKSAVSFASEAAANVASVASSKIHIIM